MKQYLAHRGDYRNQVYRIRGTLTLITVPLRYRSLTEMIGLPGRLMTVLRLLESAQPQAGVVDENVHVRFD